MTQEELTKLFDFAANGANASINEANKKKILERALAGYFEICAEIQELSDVLKIKQATVGKIKTAIAKIAVAAKLPAVVNLQQHGKLIHLDFREHGVFITQEDLL